MECAVFVSQLEKGKEQKQGLRRRMAENSVMQTHIGMKLFFLQEQVAIKEEEEKKLVLRTEQLKADLLAIKGENLRLVGDHRSLESKAGLVTQLSLLGDFKEAKFALKQRMDQNDKLVQHLGHWWEGWRKTGI